MQIPEKLLFRLKKLGLDESIYNQRTRKCVLSREELGFERVPWFKDAYFVPDDFINKKDYFIFDPVSLVPCIALAPKKQDKILDMCAAPGTKTFILSFLTDNEAHITANDIDTNRVRRLKANINKFHLSAEVLNMSGRKLEGSFGKVLLDAPCSGEGMVNKKEKIFSHWSEKRVKILAKTQNNLIAHAFELLEPGGILAYSTCTFEPEEDEAVVDFLLENFGDAVVENIEIGNIICDKGIVGWDNKKYDERIENCMRIYPQHNNTAGFFVARIRKAA